ncbi:MAG: TonB-dependent receptor [Alphaproteobacteria bacterium]
MTAASFDFSPPAYAAEAQKQYAIDAQPLSAALHTFALQSGRDFLTPPELVSDLRTSGIHGYYTEDQAIQALLQGTGLEFHRTRSNGFVLVQDTLPPPQLGAVAPKAAPSEPTIGAPEEIVVTGTAIKRQDTKALPVSVIDQAAMEARNALTPVELVTSLPQVGSIPLGESVSGSLGARGDNSSINLRGIGSNATLVLLNGRRLAPHPISASENGAPSFSVNINQLPTRGLQRVDILRDGASSLYGSDAVAGVINFITTTNFRGLEVRTRIGYPEEGGGQNYNATLTYGANSSTANCGFSAISTHSRAKKSISTNVTSRERQIIPQRRRRRSTSRAACSMAARQPLANLSRRHVNGVDILPAVERPGQHAWLYKCCANANRQSGSVHRRQPVSGGPAPIEPDKLVQQHRAGSALGHHGLQRSIDLFGVF